MLCLVMFYFLRKVVFNISVDLGCYFNMKLKFLKCKYNLFISGFLGYISKV